jgi:spermidine/putrescine transport system permease protein
MAGLALETAGTGKVAPRRQARASGWGYVAPALGFLLLFFVAPLAAMVWRSLHLKGEAGLTLANYARFIGDETLWGALRNSVELTVLSVVIALPLSYAMAASIVFAVPRRWQVAVLLLTVLPFWTSYVVRTYAWLIVLGDRGLVNSALAWTGLTDGPLELVNARAGVVIVFVHYFVMIMTLTIFVSLTRIPHNLLRAATDLGASGPRVFLTVILPLSAPGVATGVFLTIVLAVGDYVTPQIIGGGQEFTLPQAVMLYLGRMADTSLAATLSLVLTAIALVAVIAFSPWLKSGRI